MVLIDRSALQALRQRAGEYGASLVAVTKTRSAELISELYDEGLRDFGENRVQELLEKQAVLPADIRWHQIGRLQSNKVRKIAPFIHLIHSLDSLGLAAEIQRQAEICGRSIGVLIQVHIAQEESKTGFLPAEVDAAVQAMRGPSYSRLQICGLMGMASFSDDESLVRSEFQALRHIFDRLKRGPFADAPDFTCLSMGMSGDYQLALECGSTMIRVGSLLFRD